MMTLVDLKNNSYFVRLSRENNEYLVFKVYTEEDLNNVKNLQWDKVNFKHFKDNKLYKIYE